MAHHNMETRQSPLQFIDAPSSGNRHSVAGGALTNRLNQLRPAGAISSAAGIQGRFMPLSAQQTNSMLPPQHPQVAMNNRSNSTHSIHAMMRDRSMENLRFQQERPRPASARDQPLADYPFSQRTASLERSAANIMPRRLIKQQRSQSYDFSIDRSGLEEAALPPPMPIMRSMMMAQAQVPDSVVYSMAQAPSTGQLHHVIEPIPVSAVPSQHNIQVVDIQQQQQQQAAVAAAISDAGILHREVLRLQQELEVTKEKMNSCMSSIKTFWSPELKRERAMRKEENSKYAILADHLHQLQVEKQTMLTTLHTFEEDLRKERELRSKSSTSVQDLDAVKRRCEELSKEHRMALRQVEEAEHKLAGQNQAMANQEEGMRRLVDLLKAKGVRGVDRLEMDRVEIDRLRHQLDDAVQRGMQVERVLMDRETELAQLKQDLENAVQELRQLKKENEQLRLESRQMQSVQSVIETKDSKILALESEIRLLEDGIVTPTTSTSSGIEDLDKTIQNFRNNERILKSKLEQMATESAKRNSDSCTVQSRLEMAEKQQQDQNHHISVLKEQLKQRDHKVVMLTGDVEDFRKRLKEKEALIEKKSKQLNAGITDKRQLEVELSENREQADIKERKITLYQKKVENLEDLLNDKENQLISAKSRLTSLQSENSMSQGSKTEMEESLRDKDRQIERMKEQKGRTDQENLDEIELQKKLNNEMRCRLESIQREVEERQLTIADLRDEVASSRQEKFKRESELSQLQGQLMQKTGESSNLQVQLQTLQMQSSKKVVVTPPVDTESTFKITQMTQRISDLEAQVNHYIESSVKLQSEVDRLLNLVRSVETEKADKVAQFRELDEQFKDCQTKMNTLKRAQQTDRKKHAQLLEEARRREEAVSMDTEMLKAGLEERDNRIKELEHALKESVQITGDREIYFSSREDLYRQMEQQIMDQRQSVEQLQRERNSLSAQVSNLQEEIRDKDNQLKTLEDECFQNYIPEMEKLRKSSQDSNLRIGSLLKIIQGKEAQLTEQDRISLQGITLVPDFLSGYQSQRQQPFGFSNFFPVVNAPADVGRLSHALQEKEMLLQQQMEELSRLRYQHCEMENRVKALQRELEERNQRLSYFDSNQFSNATHELQNLRQNNMEMSNQISHMRRALEEKEEILRQVEESSIKVEMERLKRELHNTVTDRDTHVAIAKSDLERLTKEKLDMNNTLLQVQMELRERTDRLRQFEAEQSRSGMDLESLQKKYQAVLGQLTDKNDRLQLIERECYQVQQEEIKRLRIENEEINHRLTFMQKAINDRETKIESLEKDQFRLTDELTAARKQFHTADSELKTIRDELAFREDRIRQMQAVHNEEVNRLRGIHQDVNSRATEMSSLLEERERMIKGVTAENERLNSDLEHSRRRIREYESEINRLHVDINQRDEKIKIIETEYLRVQNEEILRYQRSAEETNGRLMLVQKKIEERDARMRKLEQENRDLLDEIHNLRKRNYDIESQLDTTKQHLSEKDDMLPSRSSSSVDMGYSSQVSSANSIELERLRKQYHEAANHVGRLQKLVEETQMQYHQTAMERDTIRNQLIEEKNKLEQFQQFVQSKESEIRKREADQSLRVSEDSARLMTQSQEASTRANQLRQDLDSREKQLQQVSRDLERSQREQRDLTQRVATLNSQLGEAQRFCEAAALERDQARAQAIREPVGSGSLQQSTGGGSSVLQSRMQSQLQTVQSQLQQSTTELERLQREHKESTVRVQQLNRQLQETQANCDQIAGERDSLRMQIQINNRGDTSGQSAHLTRELERLHRELEVKTKEFEELKSSGLLVIRERDQLKLKTRELQQRLDTSTASTTGHNVPGSGYNSWQQNGSDIHGAQQNDPTGRFASMKRDIEVKDKRLQEVSNELEKIRVKNTDFETNLRQLKDKLNQTESELTTVRPEHQRLLRERSEIESWARQMKTELEKKNSEVVHMQQLLQQSGHPVIKSTDNNMLSRRNPFDGQTQPGNGLDPVKSTEQFRQQLELKDKQIAELIGQLEHYKLNSGGLPPSGGDISMYSRVNGPHLSGGGRSGESTALNEDARRALQDKDQKLQQQADELERLRQELRVVNGREQRTKQQLPQSQEVQELKLEVDTLKRELAQRVDLIQKMEKDCMEKHVRRVDELQAKLKRCQEESAMLNRNLEEQKRAVEERDRCIKQIKADQRQATSVELERLREEHSHCADQIKTLKSDQENKLRQVRTMEGQMERQMDEILEMKQEALTAQICEKDANLALMELSGAKNPRAMGLLKEEKDKFQMQLKQLSQARAMMQEEKKNRRP